MTTGLMRPLALLALLLLCGCVASGQTASPAVPADAVSRASPAARYLDAGSLDIARFLPPPPAAGSPGQAQDLAAVLASQAARTPAAVEAARLDQEVSVSRFAVILGPGFTAQQLPRTFALAGAACQETSFVILAAKRHWDRPRPFRASPEVRPVVTNASGGSYPSGHAACGYLWSILLADLVPERRDALFARGIAYGENRVLGGVHYPSDVEAGRMAAAVIAAKLYDSAAFRADLAAARAELTAAGLPAGTLPPAR